MPLQFQPGELVVRRVRWHADADLIGIVIGNTQESTNWPDLMDVLVMWTKADRRVEFTWHLPDALMVIEATNVQEVRSRCGLGS
jgi:hypothetical protein